MKAPLALSVIRGDRSAPFFYLGSGGERPAKGTVTPRGGSKGGSPILGAREEEGTGQRWEEGGEKLDEGLWGSWDPGHFVVCAGPVGRERASVAQRVIVFRILQHFFSILLF